ncbi:hypothetical protein [Actinomadura formosensis]|uniref:hypothetical protein n=1 Tax=Actinomadura formosensis TaxID=60706 RepID=UPI003D93F091
MSGCPRTGTDRAFRRLARLGADPAATLDDPPDVTAELPPVPEEAPRHGRHRAPARLTRDRVAFGITAAALAATAALGAVMLAGGGDDRRPGVTSVPAPTAGEPEEAPSSVHPSRILPPPAPAKSRKPKRTPSKSPTPTPARTVTVTPTPQRSHSPALPSPSPTLTRSENPPPPPPPCTDGEDPGMPPTCTPTEEAE